MELLASCWPIVPVMGTSATRHTATGDFEPVKEYCAQAWKDKRRKATPMETVILWFWHINRNVAARSAQAADSKPPVSNAPGSHEGDIGIRLARYSGRINTLPSRVK
jgi:hypothetical protein